jgi:hypothetical protein
MPDEREDEEGRRTAELIEGGSEAIGALAGAGIGTVGGPVGMALGAVGGVAVTRAVKRVGAEVHERVIAPRQRARAGLALGVAVERMRERTESGEERRDDGFFDPRADGERPEAEELLEGVLLHAMNAYQERKVPYMGAFFASIAHRSDISPAYAHALLQIAEQLTYRQMVALAFFAENAGSEELMDLDVRREEEGKWEFSDWLGRDVRELGDDMALLGVVQEDGSVIWAAGTWGGPDIGRHDLAKVAPTALGRDFYELMELGRIPAEEKRDILRLLTGESTDSL